MIPISESRKYLPKDWSDDQIKDFQDMLHNFIEGMLEIIEKDQKNTIV